MSDKLTNKFMNVNVILTFEDRCESDIDSQEFFDSEIRVRRSDKNVMTFLNEKFFPRVVSYCERYDRSPKNLIKISTCAHWHVYEEITGKKPLYQHGNSCQWIFGKGRTDLGVWEKCLMDTFGFGTNVDMSWVNKRFEKQVEIE
jgi:hypothetical protein